MPGSEFVKNTNFLFFTQFFAIEVALTGGLAIISYFLKRTITELDCCKLDVSEIKETCIM